MFRAVAICAALAVPAALVAAAPMPASTYVMKAGAGDLYEIESSKLVMGSTNTKLQHFAQQMVTDHTQSTQDVKAAAMKAGMKVAPPMLNAEQRSNIAKLKAAHGTARDHMYVMQQKVAHQQALTLQEGYSMHGSVAPLKMAATKIVPVVKDHIQMLSTM